MHKKLLPLLILLFSSTALAESTSEVTVDIARYISDWEVGETSVETRRSELALRYYEPVSDRIKPGIAIGYISMTQKDNPVTEDMDFSGNYLGLFLHADFVRLASVRLGIDANYRFSTADDSENGTKVQIDWHELYGGLRTMYRLADLEFTARFGYRVIDGDESGTPIPTRRIHAENNISVSLGIDYYLEPTGYLGIHVTDGSQQGVRLVFGKMFYNVW